MRTKSAVVAVGWGAVLCLTATTAPAAAAPRSVFVRAAQVEARKEVDEAAKKALKDKRDAVSTARKALEKTLKAELGKKREIWPPEKDEELYRLEEAEALAAADYEYRKIDPKAIGDGVENVRDAVEGKGLSNFKKDHVTLAASAQDADLVVEVLARRSQKELGAVVPSYCWVLFTIGPGGKTDAAAFAKIPPGYRAKRSFMSTAWKIAGPTPERPVFVFEGYNGGGTPLGCHGAAANSAAGVIDKFIEDNASTLASK